MSTGSTYPFIPIPDWYTQKPISGTKSIAALIHASQHFGPVESAYLITLDSGNHIIACRIVCIGGENQGTLSIKEMLREAAIDRADGIVFVHTHPSGSLDPTPQDEEFLEDLTEHAEALGITVVDSIIMSNEDSQSMLAPRESIAPSKNDRGIVREILSGCTTLGNLLLAPAQICLVLVVFVLYAGVTGGYHPEPLTPALSLIILMYPLAWVFQMVGRVGDVIFGGDT